MTLLGLDFDNTLVEYDEAFHQLALEKKLITNLVPADKTAIRNCLREEGKEEAFTLMQGEIYGNSILKAKPADGMKKALTRLRRKGIKMVLVSHKTQYPYIGPRYDLRKAALSWLEKNGLFEEAITGWTKGDIYFESSKEEKLSRIRKLGGTHYVDDLEEILNELGGNITKIHYNPKASKAKYDDDIVSANTWKRVEELIVKE